MLVLVSLFFVFKAPIKHNIIAFLGKRGLAIFVFHMILLGNISGFIPTIKLSFRLMKIFAVLILSLVVSIVLKINSKYSKYIGA
jgi:hypothetical protein